MATRSFPPRPVASLLALADASRDPIAVFDAGLRHVYANDAVCRLMNVTRDAILGRTYEELPMSRDNARRMQDAVARVFATRESLRLEVRGGRETSRARVFDIALYPHLDEHGEVALVAAISRDISALRNAEEAARRNAERLELLLDAVGAAVVGIGPGLEITFANRTAENDLRELGAYRGPGQSVAELVPVGLSHDDALRPIRLAIEHNQSSQCELELTIGGQKRRLQLTVRPEARQGETNGGCVVVARDVTAERQLEGQLHLSERLSSLGRIAEGVAHEISNPLAAVYGNVELAIGELRHLARAQDALRDDLDEISEMLGEARDGCERIRLIVDDIGLLARDDSTAVGLVAMEDVARTVIQMHGAMVRRRATLEVRLDPVPLVEGSASRLAHAVSNLLQNAIQALPTTRATADNRITLTLSPSGGEVVLAIADNGVGIAAGELNRVFDPFYTTRPVGQGVGLGLTVAHGIATQYGGRVVLESRLGRGTTASLSLPVPKP
jgi:PAS domain S-box-containing protein